MRTILIIACLFLLTGCAKKEVDVPKPQINSVVYLDERTDCQKMVDIRFNQKWDELCPDKCDPESARVANLYREIGYRFCATDKTD